MNSVLLLAMAILVFIFGYRFYAKFLAVWVFRLDTNYSTPAEAHPDRDEFPVCNRHLLFGHHLASLGAGLTLVGAGSAVFWGWIPAFLWVVVGSVIAAGTYAMGSLWLASRQGEAGLANLAGNFLGQRARELFFVFIFCLLLLVNGLCAVLIAHLLASFPVAAMPFWLLLPVAWGLGAFLHQRPDFEIIPASLIALLVVFMLLWLYRLTPLALDGSLVIQLGSVSLLRIDAIFLWVIVLFVFSFYCVRQPLWKLARPQGYLAALLLTVMLGLAFVAILVRHPPLVAPSFHTPETQTDVIPWLFITVIGGALAGWHALVAHGTSLRQLKRETDTRYIGYGAALVDGLIALSAVLIGTSIFSSEADWLAAHSSWNLFTDITQPLDAYIAGFGSLVQGLGLSSRWSQSFAALTITSLCATTLVTGIRLQQYSLNELGGLYRLPSLRDKKTSLQWAVLASAAFALSDGQGSGALSLWPLYGLANHIFAIAVLALTLLALKRVHQPTGLLWMPLWFLLVIVIWVLFLQLKSWWLAQAWFLFAGGVILGGVALSLALAGWRAFGQSSRPQGIP